jgi:hypothetical protein
MFLYNIHVGNITDKYVVTYIHIVLICGYVLSSLCVIFMVVNSSFHGGMDPHCISSGHIVSQYSHVFVVYWSAPCFESTCIPSIGIPTS